MGDFILGSVGVDVTGVKGDKEVSYRSGNVNLTPSNIGALDVDNVYNDLDKTAVGYALDARQGKALADKLDATQSGLAIIVDGDTASMAVPVGGYAYIKNNTHGLAEGLYTNASSAAFPASGGTADSTVFTAVSGGGVNAIQQSMANANEWVILCDTWLHQNGTYTAHYTIDQVDEIAFVYIYGDLIRQSFAMPQSVIKIYNNKVFPDIYFAGSRIYFSFELNSTTITVSSYTNSMGGGWYIYCKCKPNVV